MTPKSPSSVDNSAAIALDVGGRRIGVAVARAGARLPGPLTTLINEGDIANTIKQVVTEQRAGFVVVGLPRGLDGQETAQTRTVKDFVNAIEPAVGVPLYWQDEAATSAQAEAELKSRGKPYVKEDIDALSATYILEDFLRDNPGELA